eukprot:EST49315.1 hypothetical protein SS50377_10540 [Spironucleus salmonicida]
MTRSYLTASLITTVLQPQSKMMFNQFFSKQRLQLQDITDNAFDELFSFFDSHKLFVMYEDLLDCNPLTDHQVPKNVLPVFYEQILELKNVINIKLAISIMQNFENTLFDMFNQEKMYTAQLELDNLKQLLQNTQSAELSVKMQELITQKLEIIEKLKNKRRIEDSQLAEQIYQMKKSNIYVPDIEIDKNLKKTSEVFEEDLSVQQYKKQNKQLISDNQHLRTILEKLNSTLKEDEFKMSQIQHEINRYKETFKKQKSKIEELQSVIDAKTSGQSKKQDQVYDLQSENERLRNKVRELMQGCNKHEIEYATPSQLITKLKEEILQLTQDLVAARQKQFNSNVVNLNTGNITSQQGNNETALLKEELKKIKQQIKDEFGVNMDDINKQEQENNLSKQDNQKLNMLLLELAKQDTKYFGLSDIEILKKIKANGDYQNFMKIIEHNNFLSQAEINKLVIEQYRLDHPELGHLTDDQILNQLQSTKDFNKYFQIVKENGFLNQKQMDLLVLEQARKDPKYGNLSDKELLTLLKEQNIYDSFKNQIKANGFLAEKVIQNKILELAKKDPKYKGLSDDQIMTMLKKNGDFEKYQNLVISGHQNRNDNFKNGGYFTSKLKKKISKDINEALLAAKGIQDATDAISALKQREGARDVGVQVQTRVMGQKTNNTQQNLAKVTKFQYFNDENDFIQIEELNTDKLLKTTMENSNKFSFLKHFMSQRLSINDVYQRLFKDAELNQSRLEQIKDLYFHNFKAPDQLLDPNKTIVISYYNDQLDRVRYAVQFSEEIQPAKQSVINRQMTASTFQRKQQLRGELSQFQFQTTGCKFILKPQTANKPDAYRISRPISQQQTLNLSQGGTFGFDSGVDYNKSNTLLLSHLK